MNPHEMQANTEISLMNRRKFIGNTTLATLGVASGLTFLPFDSAEANPLLYAIGRFALGIGAGILANTIYDYLRDGQKAHASPNYRTSQKKKVSYDYFPPSPSSPVTDEVVKANQRLDMDGFNQNASPVYGTDEHFFYAVKHSNPDLFLIPFFKTSSIDYSSYRNESLACTCAVNNERFTDVPPRFFVIMLDVPTLEGLTQLATRNSACGHKVLQQSLLPTEDWQRAYQLGVNRRGKPEKLSSKLGENYHQNCKFKTAMGKVESRYKNRYGHIASAEKLDDGEFQELFPSIKYRV